MGLGVVGLEPDRLAVFGDGLVELLQATEDIPKADVGLGVSGLSRIASLYSTVASASFPCSWSSFPRS